MLDLNDLDQIALADRRGWLKRAARAEERWQHAVQWGHSEAEVLPVRPSDGVVWLVLPTPLQGIGMAVQALHTAHDSPTVLCWRPDLPILPGVWLDLSHGLAAPERLGPILALPDIVKPQAHPSEVFLVLLTLLDRWLDRDLTSAAVQLPEEGQRELAQSVASIPVADNPAKRLAHALSERLPIFWALDPLSGVAYDWWQRTLHYAETKSEWSTAEAIRYAQVMARFPRYWPQAGAFVRLALAETERPSWLEGLDRLSQRRRLQQMTVPAPAGSPPAAAMLYLLELGEWVALYTAALLGVDPAERVALDFLEMF